MSGNIITEGKLRTNQQPFYVRFLSIDDLSGILELQKIVAESMEISTALQPLSDEEFSYILSGNGSMIGIFVEDKMIAFRAMLIPEIDEDEHLGIDAGLSEVERSKMIYSEISNVHPGFRGNRLQTYMGELVMEQVDKDRFQYVATTVAPFNIPSIKDKLALGMEIVALKKKYNGELRYILFRDFSAEPTEKSDKNCQTVSMSDFDEQEKLLEKGYKGVSIHVIDGNWYVEYVK